MTKYLLKIPELSEYIGYADELPLWSAPFGLKLLEAIKYRENIVALDIGFGTGFPLIELAMRLGEKSLVYGIDPWKDATDRVRRKIEYYEIRNIRILEGEAESIHLENQSVDLIVSNNGINNAKSMEKVFAECSRVIRKGGQFIQTLNLNKTMVEFYDQLKIILREMGLESSINAMHLHINEKRKPLEDIRAKLENNGFEIVRMDQYKFRWKFASGSAMLNHHFIRLAFLPAWIDFLPPNHVEQIFKEVENRLNETTKINNGFQLTIPYVLIEAVRK